MSREGGPDSRTSNQGSSSDMQGSSWMVEEKGGAKIRERPQRWRAPAIWGQASGNASRTANRRDLIRQSLAQDGRPPRAIPAPFRGLRASLPGERHPGKRLANTRDMKHLVPLLLLVVTVACRADSTAGFRAMDYNIEQGWG